MITITVTAGETLSGIAAQYGTSYQAIAAASGISNPNLIYVGQKVVVPSGGGSYTQWTPPSHSSSAGSGGSYGHPNYCGDGDGDGWDVSCGHVTHQSSPSSTAPVQQSHVSSSSSGSGSSSGGSSSSSGFHIPGASDALSRCIAFRESTNNTNPAANGNVFGIIPASGYNVAGMSVAQQEQVAGHIMATTGPSAWSADGCPGT